MRTPSVSRPFHRRLVLLVSILLGLGPAVAGADNPRVLLETSMGAITLELDAGQAPVSTENFLGYVRDGHYDGTIFHRVIRDFMIQGGGFNPNFEPKPTRPPIRNESDNGLSNVRGSVAMARTREPDTATAQFFINVVDNDSLDYVGPGTGYAVFGRVVDGMDVVDAIRAVETGAAGPFQRDAPKTLVVIERARILDTAQSGDQAE